MCCIKISCATGVVVFIVGVCHVAVVVVLKAPKYPSQVIG